MKRPNLNIWVFGNLNEHDKSAANGYLENLNGHDQNAANGYLFGKPWVVPQWA